MKRNIAIFVGHPRLDSFGVALAHAYEDGARTSGARVRMILLAECDFDLHVRFPSLREQELEPGLKDAMDSMKWADHVVFVYPTWWATMPALLKGFLDRALLPGFAFCEDEASPTGYAPLLKGRSGQLITTMDSPKWVYRFLYGMPGDRAMRRGILGFCGIRPVATKWIVGVKNSSLSERQATLEEVRQLGQQAPAAIRWAHRRRRCLAWFKIMRLQFYAMTLFSYGLGAAVAASMGLPFSWPVFLIGFGCLFVLEFASVLVNEVNDQETDRRNQHASPFTGGSRVLVDGDLSATRVRQVASMALLVAGGSSVVLLALMWWFQEASPLELVSASALIMLGMVLGPGYTAPPLKLVYRGFGEWVVAFTHAPYMLVCGWVFAGGHVTHGLLGFFPCPCLAQSSRPSL